MIREATPIERATVNIARCSEQFRESARLLALGLAPAVRQMGEAMYHVAETCYLEAHGRLPGSVRTKRLRKKRRDAVVRWFAGEP